MPNVALPGRYRIAKPVLPQPGTGASSYLTSASAGRCPECGDLLTWIPRRGVDRVLSLFVSLSRFRCPNVLCLWEGNLRSQRSQAKDLLPTTREPKVAAWETASRITTKGAHS
jgi:hypothetical protein